MANRKREAADGLVRTSVLITEQTDAALRDLAAKGNRPLSREIRQALEAYVADYSEAAA